jgi:hypothetical protein
MAEAVMASLFSFVATLKSVTEQGINRLPDTFSFMTMILLPRVILIELCVQGNPQSVQPMTSSMTTSCVFPLKVFLAELPIVFFLMTINAEVFPIRSISRIVQMIPVLMVDRQQMSVLMIKFSPALGANEAVDLKRPLSIITVREARFL